MSSRIKIADEAGGSNVMRLQMSSGPDCRCLVDLGKNPIFNSIPRTMETFPGGPVVKHPPASAGDGRDTDSIPALGKSSGERSGSLLQYSCLENSMDKGILQATYSSWGLKEADLAECAHARAHTHTHTQEHWETLGCFSLRG